MKSKLSLIAGTVAATLALPLAWAAEPATAPAPDHFIKEAIQGNLAEVKVGGLAQEKGASEGVKDFGATLAKDHATANDKAKEAAQNLGVSPPSEPSAKQKTMYQELEAMSGQKFDQHFVRDMVKDHKEDIAKYQKEAEGSGPAADYAKAILPDLRKHLKTAEQLEKQQRTASASEGSSKMK